MIERTYKHGLRPLLDASYVGSCHFRETDHVAAAPPEALPDSYEQAHGAQLFQTNEDCFAASLATSIRDRMLLQGVETPRLPSARWIYWWGRYPLVDEDVGLVPDVAIDQILKRGYCADEHMPYASTLISDTPSDEARQYAFEQRGKLKVHRASTTTEIRQALHRGLTVHMGSRIDKAYEDLPPGAVWRPSGTPIGGHEYRIIGWDGGALRIMGSWPEWSDGGYGWVAEDVVESDATMCVWVVDWTPSYGEDIPA